MASLLNKKTLVSLTAATGLFFSGLAGGVFAAENAPAAEGTTATAPEKGAEEANAEPKQVTAEQLLAPGKLKVMAEGDENAPVTIIEYASLTCSHCSHFVVETLPLVREKYIKTGKVRLVFREFGYDPRAIVGFMLARCVPEDRYFPFIQVLFEKQEDWAFVKDAKPPLIQIAKLAGLSEEKFDACLKEQSIFEGLNAEFLRGRDEFGIRATPTFFINGRRHEGALGIDEISKYIDEELQKAEANKK